MDLSSHCLEVIRQTRLPELNLQGDLIYPTYQGYSIANLPATVARLLGLPWVGSEPLAEKILAPVKDSYDQVILLLIDGFGWNLLEQVRHQTGWKNILSEAHLAVLSSIVPSTTASALTTLWTGVLPAQHGVIGYEMWLKQQGVIANMITHSPATFRKGIDSLQLSDFDAETFLPVPTIGKRFKAEGAAVTVLQPSVINHSGLSNMLFAATNSIPYFAYSDLWVSLSGLVKNRSVKQSYVYAYISEIDTLTHHFGPNDERVHLELMVIGNYIDHFIRKAQKYSDGRTLLMISADHGLIETPPVNDFDLNLHPDLLACLVMQPTCENRLPFLYLRPGREEEAEVLIRQKWGNQFQIIQRKQVLESGLLGSDFLHEDVDSRIGDWMVVPQKNAYWWWKPAVNQMHGRHGGLSPEEMLVPLLMITI